MNLYNDIKAYEPFNEQEAYDKEVILRLMGSDEELFTRDNKIAHFTASAWIVSLDHSKVLLAYHNIYNSWAWLGGHADGDHDLEHVALKEVAEECGIEDAKLIPGIYSLEILTVDGHVKKGHYVSSHLHLNVTYLIEADPELSIRNKADENSDVAWFDRNEFAKAVSEKWMLERIYRKLDQRLR